MANVIVNNATYQGVNKVSLKKVGGGTTQFQVPTLTEETTVTPTESILVVVPSTGYLLSKVTVNAIDPTYVGSSVARRSSSNLSVVNNLTVRAPAGYYSSQAEKTLSDSNLVASNIKNGVRIFGVTGNYSGGQVNIQSNKNATPTSSQQEVKPDSGYDALAKVTVSGDANLVAGNIKDGVSIFGVTGTYSGGGGGARVLTGQFTGFVAVDCGFTPDLVIVVPTNSTVGTYSDSTVGTTSASLIGDFRSHSKASPATYWGTYPGNYGLYYAYIYQLSTGFHLYYAERASGAEVPINLSTATYNYIALKL